MAAAVPIVDGRFPGQGQRGPGEALPGFDAEALTCAGGELDDLTCAAAEGCPPWLEVVDLPDHDLFAVDEENVDRVAQEGGVDRPRRAEEHPFARVELRPAEQPADPVSRSVGYVTPLADDRAVLALE